MTEREVTVYSLVADMCDRFQSLDDAAVAHRVLAAIAKDLQLTPTTRKRFNDWWLPVTTALVANTRRTQSRAGESAAFAGVRGPKGKAASVVAGGYEADISVLRSVLHQTFRLGRAGEVVSWGRATVAEHEQRIGSLTTYRNGVDVTISRHRTAIAVIVAANATCLAEALEAAA